MGDWKLVVTNVLKEESTEIELFNLNEDQGETKEISGDHPEMTEQLLNKLSNSRTGSEIFTFKQPTIIK